jgi:hypothetical protein
MGGIGLQTGMERAAEGLTCLVESPIGRFTGAQSAVPGSSL